MRKVLITVIGTLLSFTAINTDSSAQAIILASTNEDSIADDAFGFRNPRGVGTHFHDNPPAFGTPADVVEVGDFALGFGAEEVRGVAEFDLRSLLSFSSVSLATLNFDVLQQGGLFDQPPASFNLEVLAFLGNGSENLSDYQIATVGSVGTLDTAALSAGTSISLNVTSLVNSFLTNSDDFIGFRLQATSNPRGRGAVVFDNFTINADVQAVPEPCTILGLTLLAGLGYGMKRKFEQSKA
jgi:hypothetical protein